MIVGTGVDIVEVARINKSLEKYSPRFEEKIFTADEIGYCRSKAKPDIHFAARFAAKEAVMKCMGVGMDQQIAFKDIEITNLKTGKPQVNLSGKGKELFILLKIKTIHISLSHDKNYAVAQAIAES
ncbi:MAG: holo-[acyl-carrier-protein] synthase [Nitrospinaceae bacterium]|nr:MAG: holo-[acyl-carrier-protein] synthase [Nitrospinaceae bacterium]